MKSPLIALVTVFILILEVGFFAQKPAPMPYNDPTREPHLIKVSNVILWQEIYQEGFGMGDGSREHRDYLSFDNMTFLTWNNGKMEKLPLDPNWHTHGIYPENNTIILTNYLTNRLLHVTYGEQIPFKPLNRTDWIR